MVSPRLKHPVLLGALWLTLSCFGISVQADEQPSPQGPEECPTYVGSPEDTDPDELILDGVACFEAEKYEWALTHYRRAYEMDNDPFLLGAIGRSLHELGLYDPAMDHYRRFLDSEEDPSGADRIRERIDELETRLEEDSAEVSLRSSPPGVRAYVVLDNGEWHPLGTTPLETRLREESWEFVFVDDDHRPQRDRIDLERGESNRVGQVLVPRASASAMSYASRRRLAMWTMAGSLLVTTAGGVLLVISAQETSAAERLDRDDFATLSDYDHRQRHHLDMAATTRTWGTITAGVGVAGLLAGTALLLSTPSPTVPEPDDGDSDSPETTGVQLEPSVGFGHVGIRGWF